MKMRSLRLLMVLPCLLILFAACSSPEQTTAVAAQAPAAKPHMDMLQLMRAFPFPHVNVLFDTQRTDPAGSESKSSMSFSVYRWGDTDVYAGWAGVENSALALAEMAPLLLTPRSCANGLPAPVDRTEWKNAVAGLAAAGEVAYKAAKARDMDAMVEVSETLSNACAACHDVYRDIDLSGGIRCSLPK